jgi:phytoene dehydrogenase-like protein
MLSQTPPSIFPFGSRKSFFKKALELYRAGSFCLKIMGLGSRLPEAIELLTGAAAPILNRWFESEILKTTLATDAIIGAFTSPYQEGSAYVLMHHVMGEAGGARGVWGYVRGGMGGLADSLEKSCLELGVDIRRETSVDKILIDEKGRAYGVSANNEVLDSKIVVSSVDPNLTFNHFIGKKHLPEDFFEAIMKIDYSSASAKINLALDRLPDFNGVKRVWSSSLKGTIHISPSMQYIEKAFDDAKYGYPSKNPVLEITIPSTVDSTLAPEGKHVMNIFVQYAPYNLKNGNWDDEKKEFGERCVDIIEEYSPGFKDSILHTEVVSPLDLERIYGLTGGNIFQGAMKLSQMFVMRPVAGWSDYRTPIKGVYMCGSAAHPGGGVMGTCGRNAAREILKDLK